MSLWLGPLRDGGVLQGAQVDNDVAEAVAAGIPGEFYKVMGFSAGYSGTAPSAGFKTVTFKRGFDTVLVVRHDFANLGNIEGFSLPGGLRSRIGERFSVELEAGGAAGCLGQVKVFATPTPSDLYDPLDAPGLLAWYDPYSITGLSPTDELPASNAWLDSGPNGLDMDRFDQGTGGPLTYEVVGGIPEVKFTYNASNMTHLRVAYDWLNLAPGNRFAIYSVMAAHNSQGISYHSFGPTDFAGAYGNNLWVAGDNISMRRYGFHLTNGLNVQEASYIRPLNQFNVVSLTVEPGYAALFVDGQRVRWTSNTSAENSWFFFATSYLAHFAAHQRQRDAIYCIESHDPGTRRALEETLAAKYDIPINQE